MPMRDGRLSREARNALLARDDRRRGGAGAAQQLSAAAGALARRAARPRGSRLRAAADADARSRGELDRAVEFLPDDMEIAERRRRSQALTRPELAVLLAYAKLALNHELRAFERAGRSLSRPRARALFPARGGAAVPRRARASPAAPRDHRHPARQFHDQPRRAVAAGAHRRPDRRRAPRASPRRSPRCATATA